MKIRPDSRMRISRSVLITTLLSACAPAPVETGRVIVQATDVSDLALTLDCDCFWADYDYASYAACLNDNVTALTHAQETCIIEVGRSFPTFEDLVTCRLSAEGARYDCYLNYDDVCDAAGFDACDDAYETARACGDADPCISLAGDAERECEIERARLFADVGNCR